MYMKKILLSSFTFLTLLGSAQTLTQANHAPAVGNPIYATYQCDSAGISPGGSGAGQNWNYAITEHLSVLSTYTTSASSNIAFNPADVSVSSAANNTVYYKSSSSVLDYYGGDISIAAFDLNVKYTSPAVVAIYPMSLNSTTTSATSGSVNVISPLATSGTFNGSCVVTADATGTLTLPAKTFTNVIRVVTSQTLSASIAGGATVNLLVYDYYSTDASKAPILTINTSTISSLIGGTSTQTIVSVQKNYDVVGLNEAQKTKIELSVFPNPASHVINFNTHGTEAFKVTVFDMTGKLVSAELMDMGKAKMNTSNFTSGVYTYLVSDKNNQILTSGKFNISK